jgi:predicted Zn-dependent protease
MPRLPPANAIRFPGLRRVLAAGVAALMAVQPLGPASWPLATAHAQSLPDLGDESQSALGPQQERKLGETVVRQIRAAGAYLEDPEINDYLNVLGHRLVAAVPEGRQDFVFFAIADPSINAFALPGGYVGVNPG